MSLTLTTRVLRCKTECYDFYVGGVDSRGSTKSLISNFIQFYKTRVRLSQLISLTPSCISVCISWSILFNMKNKKNSSNDFKFALLPFRCKTTNYCGGIGIDMKLFLLVIALVMGWSNGPWTPQSKEDLCLGWVLFGFMSRALTILPSGWFYLELNSEKESDENFDVLF